MRTESNSTQCNSEQVSILLVEDNPADARYIELTVDSIGSDQYQLERVSRLRAGLDRLEQGGIDVVLLDLNLPDSLGINTVELVKAAHPSVPIVVLSATEGDEMALQAVRCGAQDYIPKDNIKAILLKRAIRYAVERQQMVIEKQKYTQRLEERVREQTVSIRRAHEETILRLVAASMYRDEETGAHIERVGLYSELLAEAIGWPQSEVDNIRMAAPMHDVGKIGIPDAILQKPGKLTETEYEVMMTHTTIGAKMLADSDSPMLRMACQIALCHHERWDGTGYPRGLSDSSIPEHSRIVGIVDVFDALSNDRVYRPAFSEEEVLRMLRQGHKTHFDPFLLDAFLLLVPEMKAIGEDHPDTPTEGSSGELELALNYLAPMPVATV